MDGRKKMPKQIKRDIVIVEGNYDSVLIDLEYLTKKRAELAESNGIPESDIDIRVFGAGDYDHDSSAVYATFISDETKDEKRRRLLNAKSGKKLIELSERAQLKQLQKKYGEGN